ncbi:MAG TPA: hypothetical protein PLB67_03490 [Candidatus Hydrogenedentes bacterium]|jgi:hypothetical protein|nr:hypothetical protein [Candidatus Hydrogenedentota bacterium]MDY0031649.1 hypothetical protein [FCB group bacterium]NLT61470.1 hypothetical protein [Candidatus Hydrogenedentota bacterium]HNZ17094.1 hypothetical protein [Candidatus Hydrogenedentota bacterium]HPA03471.1 hypothetical protein [Candidatus Hydrogenedentota bacterium]
MLHDPSHYEPPAVVEEIRLPARDKAVLRALAGEVAEIAALPVHEEKAALWRRLNDLDSARPMVWVNEICWNEMNVGDELTLRTRHPWAQDQERGLRRLLYQWRHLPGDMIVDGFLTCPLAIHSTDFGIIEDVDTIKMDETSDICSRHFKILIKEPEDIQKIRMPVVTHDEKATEIRYQAMCEVYDGIMPVRKSGQTHIWFTPWDYLIRWWGVQEAMLDIIARPDMVHAAVDRMVDAWMAELDQFVEQNLLSLDCNNTRVGSGGYGYVSALPGPRFEPEHVKPHNMWGCSNAQIFSDVSPDMHWAFAVEHDLRWLTRWGLTYYGCCEPLDGKIDMLRRIPNLRKISVSPWCNPERAVNEIGRDYVISHKPNPAILAETQWDPVQARKNIRAFLDAAGGQCHVELIMKDVSTVRYHPQRLWEWTALAMEEAER